MTGDATSDLRTPRRRPWLAALILVAVTGGTILGFYLSIFPLRGLTVPIGWDSSQYVWRTKLAQEVGIAGTPDAAPRYVPVKKGRPAFPLLAGVLSTTTGQNPTVVTLLLPAILATAAGLAAAALVTIALRAPPAAFAFVGVVVGVSPALILMLQYAYLENLMVAAVFLAAAVPLVASVEHRRAVLPAALLVGAIALIHGLFFALIVATVVLTAALWLPRSLAARRAGTPLLETPSGRLAAAALGGAAIGGVGLFGLLADRPSPQLEAHQFAKKLHDDLPWYRLPVSIPVAGAGAVALAREGRTDERAPSSPRARALLLLLLGWASVTAGGFLLAWLTPKTVPLNRLLIFALPIPILAAVAALWLARAAMRRWNPRAGLIVLGAAGLVVLLVSGYQWMTTAPQTDGHKLRDAAWVAQYLDATGVPASRPVVFVVSSDNPEPQLDVDFKRDHLLAQFPARRMREVHMFLGTPEDYLARRPSEVAGQPRYRRVSARLLDRIGPTYDRDPVAILLSYTNDGFRSWATMHPKTVTGGILAVLRGPPVPAGMRFVNPVTTRRPIELGPIALLTLALVSLVGLGWTRALRRWLGAAGSLALAPAVGVAALVAAAAVLDRLGVRPRGWGAVTALLVAGVGGWIVARVRRPADGGVGEVA